MKYVNEQAEYTREMDCRNNMKKALKQIGKINPYNLKRCGVKKNGVTVIKTEKLSEHPLLSLGIMNIRRKLNGHAGKSGKYTIRMIRKTAELKKIDFDSAIKYKATAPRDYMDYIHIVKAIYELLSSHAPEYCQSLLHIEQSQEYTAQNINKNMSLKTITPIQTNVFIRAHGKNEQLKTFSEEVIKIAKGGNTNE